MCKWEKLVMWKRLKSDVSFVTALCNVYILFSSSSWYYVYKIHFKVDNKMSKNEIKQNGKTEPEHVDLKSPVLQVCAGAVQRPLMVNLQPGHPRPPLLPPCALSHPHTDVQRHPQHLIELEEWGPHGWKQLHASETGAWDHRSEM